MKLTAVVALLILLISGLIWSIFKGKPDSDPEHLGAPVAEPVAEQPASETAVLDPVTDTDTLDVIARRQQIDDLTLALQTIVAERKTAEAQLQQAERDVAALERFVEEIEERGEDPVDYADEGLAMFQPAFYAYQSAIERLELAEAMEKTARDELSAAELARAKVLSDHDSE